MVNFWGGHGLTSGIWRLEERKEQLSRGMRLRSRVECAHARSWHTLSSSSLARCERVIQNHRGRLRQRAVRDIPFAKRATSPPLWVFWQFNMGFISAVNIEGLQRSRIGLLHCLQSSRAAPSVAVGPSRAASPSCLGPSLAERSRRKSKKKREKRAQALQLRD